MLLFYKYRNYNTIGKISLFFASFFSTGLIKYAPGTVGSLVAMLVSYGLILLTSVVWQFWLAIALFIIGWISVAILKKQDKITDPSYVVIDEASAIFLINFCIYAYVGQVGFLSQQPFLLAIINFLVFRFFDIVKPSIIGTFDRTCKTPFGVMFDDTLAALISIPIIIIGLTAYDYLITNSIF